MVGLGPKKPPSRKGTGMSLSMLPLLRCLRLYGESIPMCEPFYAGMQSVASVGPV